MATANELLAGLSTGDDTTLVIDNYLRTISIPKGITNLGVESDDEVLRLNFKMPRYLDDTDLSTFPIRINYLNAQGEGDVYTVSDKIVGSNYISFSWLVGPTATAYKGDTKFNVCMKTLNSDGYVDREYNTTIATLPVLEGLEVDEQVVAEYSDILEQWRQELFGIGDTEEASMRAVSQEEQENIAQKGAEVLATIPEEYQETAEAAQKGIRTKADAIVCTTQGESIVVSDSSDDHLRGLRVFGKTTQATTTGKNLLNITATSQTNNGGTIIVNSDNTITLHGTFSSNTAIAIGKFAHSGECVFSVEIDGASINNSYLYIAYADADNVGWYGSDKTFSNDGTERPVFLVIIEGSYSNVTIKPMIRFSDVEDPTYEPYSGGFASPSPNWAQDIVPVSGASVLVDGKNIIGAELSRTVTLSNGITYTSVEGSSEFIFGGTQSGSGNASGYLVSGKKLCPGTYTLSVSGLYGNDYINLQRYSNELKAREYMTTGITNKSFRIFTIDKPTTIYIEFVAYRTSVYSDDIVTVQLEVGSRVTEYETHKQTQSSQPLANILRGIPVTSNSNYTDSDGQRWVCDEVDFERGVYVQRIGVITMDTAKSISYSLSGTTGRGQLVLNPKLDKATNRDAIMCNMAIVNHTAMEAVAGEYYVNPVNVVLVGELDENEESMRSRYASLEMLYILAEPVETALTAEEIAAYKALCSNYPNTTVLNDAGAYMELQYNADTETWVRNYVADNSPIKSTSITLDAFAWMDTTSGYYYQDITGLPVTFNSKIDLQPSPEQLSQLLDEEVSLTVVNHIGGDQPLIRVYAIGNCPSSTMTIQAQITEVVRV